MRLNRRDLIASAAALAATPAIARQARTGAQSSPSLRAASGPEGQRHADLGDGRFLNPVLAGDQPDPSVLRDRGAYYKVSSTFDYYPGLLIWASDDLVSWRPIGPALTKVVGTVFAPDLIKHDGRFFIYFPAVNYGTYPATVPRKSIYVVHADSMDGPWSDPVDLGIRNIDPGHVVGEDGKRYLFLAEGLVAPLSQDGLSAIGEQKQVYHGWPIPPDWAVEQFALESPKLIRRDGWFYAFWAQGGTGGPPTSHMVVVARSHSIHGPWENCPHNPIVHTQSADEPWWSRGHATPVQGPAGDWWMVYHGYENGFRTLGRQMLVEPMAWTADGWPKAMGGDLAKPLRKPVPGSLASGGMPLSDDFSKDHLGARFTVFNPKPEYRTLVQAGGGRLRIAAAGKQPSSGTIVTWNAGDRRYMVTAELEIDPNATAALLLFYSMRAYSGLGASPTSLQYFKIGRAETYLKAGPAVGRRTFLRIVNDAQTASFFVSADGANWRREVSYDVAGLNHNVFDQFLSLRPAIAAMGEGAVTVGRFEYRAL